MTDLIKEEFHTTIKKKRFIILTAILFIFAVVDTVTTKNDNLNDLTYMLSKQDYLWSDFSPFMGLILIFSLYRKQYTNDHEHVLKQIQNEYCLLLHHVLHASNSYISKQEVSS